MWNNVIHFQNEWQTLLCVTEYYMLVISSAISHKLQIVHTHIFPSTFSCINCYSNSSDLILSKGKFECRLYLYTNLAIKTEHNIYVVIFFEDAIKRCWCWCCDWKVNEIAGFFFSVHRLLMWWLTEGTIS